MKKIFFVLIMAALITSTAPAAASESLAYGDINLSGGFQAGHFPEWWDLTAGDITIQFTYDGTGLVDDAGTHAWAEFGVRSPCDGDFNPTWMSEGSGVWLATDYDWTANTFDPDPDGALRLDLDDKLLLQKAGGMGEGAYNLPATPPNPGANHRFWFDRDGVDQWQAMSPLAVDGGTYNTQGSYEIVLTLHALSASEGTAYMTINGLAQGFEVDGNWNTMELTPAGMTFTGDMQHLQVFYGLYGYGTTHSVAFNDVSVEGVLGQKPLVPCEAFDPGYQQALDIKPGSYPNSINKRNNGTIPVAILSSAGFDAPSVVDPESVTFGATGFEASLALCNLDGEDVNSDGLLDLVCHFYTSLTGFIVGDTYGYLQGSTYDGLYFWGVDTVNILK